MSPSRPYRDAAGKTLTDYPRPSVAVDTAVLTVPDGADTVHVLLVRRAGSHEKGAWALPGTFLHDGETLADAVLRSLRDKAGVQGLAPRQLHVFDDPAPRRPRLGAVRGPPGRGRLAPDRRGHAPARTCTWSPSRRPTGCRSTTTPSSPWPWPRCATGTGTTPTRTGCCPARSPSTNCACSMKPSSAIRCSRTPSADTCNPNSGATTRYREGVVGKPALLFRHPRPRR